MRTVDTIPELNHRLSFHFPLRSPHTLPSQLFPWSDVLKKESETTPLDLPVRSFSSGRDHRSSDPEPFSDDRGQRRKADWERGSRCSSSIGPFMGLSWACPRDWLLLEYWT